MKKVDLILLLLILILAFLLGSRMILAGDFFYLFDQARDYLIVKNIVDTKDITLIGTHSGLGGFFHGPLWLYMLVPVYLLGHGNPLAFAYFYIFLQLVTVLAAFLFGSKLYGVKGGVLISLLFALSPVTWSTVSNTIGVNTVPLVFLGLLYFLIKFIRGHQGSFIYVAFFTGLSLQFETALPLVLIPSVLVVFILNKIALKNIKVILLSFGSFLLSVSTFVLFDLRHKFLMTNSVLGAFSGGRKERGYLEIQDKIPAHIESLIGAYKSLLFKENIFLIVFLVIIFILAAFYIYRDKKNKFRKEFFYLSLFPVLIFVFFIFYPYKIWPEYVFGLIVPVAFAFYISIFTIWKSRAGKIIIVLFFTFTFFQVLISINTQYFQRYQENNSSGSYKNQKEIINWIFQDKGTGEFGYLVYTPEVYTHGMDYLMSWYGKKYPKLVPKNTKEKTTYLILYPHLENDENAYKFWKENVARTKGKILTTKVFKGNITVEKLLIDKDEPAVDPNYYQGLLFR